MEWFKQKKEEAKQVAAKIQNKRTAFKGEGNVLGGGNADCENTSSSASSTNGKTGFKVCASMGNGYNDINVCI